MAFRWTRDLISGTDRERKSAQTSGEAHARISEAQDHVSVDHGTPLDPGSDFSERIGNGNLLRRAVNLVCLHLRDICKCAEFDHGIPWTQDLILVNGEET